LLRNSKQKVINALTAFTTVNQGGDGVQQEDVDFLGCTKEQRQIVKLLKKTEHLEAIIMTFVTKLGPLLDSLCTYCSKHGYPQETCWILNPDLKPKGFSNTSLFQEDEVSEEVVCSAQNSTPDAFLAAVKFDGGRAVQAMATIHGITGPAMFDYSVITMPFLQTLQRRSSAIRLKPWEERVPVRLAIAGRTRLKVRVGSTKALLDFAVIEDGSTDFLIGSPGLNHLGVTISYPH
ncbi:hypothetical protein QOT17_024174, partial [Balamuthia mandrillaris]